MDSLAHRFRPPLCIGSLVIDPPLLQAPMAGFSNYAYRQILRALGGVGLPATEMVGARGFLHICDRDGSLPDRLWGVKDEPRPLTVQIWDNDPGVLAETGARLVAELAPSVIDINFGCPVPEITASARSGSYLLDDPERIGAIVGRVAAACRPTPVTAKIRLGCTRARLSAIDVAQAVEGAGGAALTVHGRTAQEMYRGRADWDEIAKVKPHLKRIPLIGNGDLRTPQDVLNAFARYGVDGVMIGRAALGQPWLFREAAAAFHGESPPVPPTLTEQRDMLWNHYCRIVARFGPGKGTILMRRYACCYAQGFPGARRFRARVAQVSTPEEFAALLRSDFPDRVSALLDKPAVAPDGGQKAES